MTERKASMGNDTPQSRERGVALIVALLAMVVISGLGFALLVSSSTESMINASFRRASLSYFSARGGLEEARGRMGPDAAPVGNCPAHTTPATACVSSVTTNIAIPCLITDPDCLQLFDPIAAPSVTNPNFNGGYYILLNNTINPASCTYLGVPGICTDPSPPSSPRYYTTSQPGATQTPYVWTKITLATQRKLKRNLVTPCNPSDPSDPSYCDPATLDDAQMICWKNQTTLALMDNTSQATRLASCGNPINQVYILTSLAVEPGTPRPTTRLVREVVSPGKIPGLPGPLTLDGIPGVYIPPTAFPFDISGCDASNPAPCNAPPDAPAVVVPSNADVVNAQAAIPDGPPPGQNRNQQYRGITNNGCTPAVNCSTPNSASVVSATDATVFPSGNPLATNPYFADCAGVQTLQSYITTGADYVYNGDTNSLSTPGSFNNNITIINVINGNANLAATDLRPSPSDTGAGILLVTGNLTMAGTSNYHGIIIVLGGTITIGGGGGGTVTGGIFVTNTTMCPTSLGPATYDPSGGALTIQYDSTWANPQNGWLPMQILSMN